MTTKGNFTNDFIPPYDDDGHDRITVNREAHEAYLMTGIKSLSQHAPLSSTLYPFP